MWNSVASTVDVLSMEVVQTFHNHPIVGGAFVIAQSVLIVMLGMDLRASPRATQLVDKIENTIPMQLRR